MLKKIIVTGGEGRFAQELKKIKSNNKFIFKNKNQLDILSIKSIKKNLNKYKPNILLHLAGLSRPMSIHDKMINRSIDLNIIGTSNLVKVCNEKKIKLIYFSTSYVYPGEKGNYKEKDPVLPWNNYGWSKLGAESAVQMYKNSLIVRACMTEKPFTHKFAFDDVKTNFIFHEDLVKMLPKVIAKKGILNIGGKIQSVYKFAKKTNPLVKGIKSIKSSKLPLNQTMDISLLKKIIKDKEKK